MQKDRPYLIDSNASDKVLTLKYEGPHDREYRERDHMQRHLRHSLHDQGVKMDIKAKMSQTMPN